MQKIGIKGYSLICEPRACKFGALKMSEKKFIENVEIKENNSKFLYFSVITVNLASFTMGASFGWSSPSIPKLNGKEDPANSPLGEPISSTEELFLASLITIGGTIGPFFSATAADSLGRKPTLLYLTAPFLISYIILATASNIWWYYIARFFLGIASGAYYSIIPNYVAEISEKHNRGALSCFLSLIVPIGILFMYAVGPYLSIMWTSLLCLVCPVLFLILVWGFVPESPYFLLSKHDEGGARAVLAKLRGRRESEVFGELAEIREVVEESFGGKTTFVEMLRSKVLVKGLLMTSGLVIFQQFSGINVLLFYMQTIFQATGSELSPQVSSMIIASVQISAAGITAVVVDKLGRRFLLIISSLGSAVALTCLASFFHLKDNNYPVDSITWLPILSLILFIISFGVGLAPVPFTILGEIFPQNAKAAASTLTISICFGMAFVTTILFPYLMDVIGMAPTFFILAAFCVVSIFFVYFFVPETKGKSFSEIQTMMNK